MGEKSTLVNCSFCAKHKSTVAKLIVGYDVAICNECVELCNNLLSNRDTTTAVQTTRIVDPRDVKQYLDDYVVSQTQAKTLLSVAITNHYKRITNKDISTPIQKANILIIGPTGTGKTLLAKTIAQYLDVPFVIGDATSLTEAGYVGEDVETLIARLYQAAGNNVEKTQQGIVFIDEIDKIARTSESATNTRDVSGQGVQQSLLKLVEGTVCKVNLPNAKKNELDSVMIDTTNILFIVGGAFVGLDNIVKKRVQGSAIGFAAQLDKTTGSMILADDLIAYGMIPEFTGRFPCTVELCELTISELVQILTDVKHNLVDQYRWLFEQDGVDLQFDSTALALIAQNCLNAKTGARGLQTELERVLLPHMFELRRYNQQGKNSLTITLEMVNNPKALEKEIV